MSSTLVLLRYDIAAAHHWITTKLVKLDQEELTSQEVEKDFNRRSDDIQDVIKESKTFLTNHINHDPVLQLSLAKLIKSYHTLNHALNAKKEEIEPLSLPLSYDSDSDSVSSYSSDATYTSRFDLSDLPARSRRFIPHLTPLYRAVIRATVKHHKRSSGSTTPSSLSVSPRSSAHSTSPATSPGRAAEIYINTTTTTSKHTRQTTQTDVSLDLSDSESEFEPFPWVSVSDDELELPDKVNLVSPRYRSHEALKTEDHLEELTVVIPETKRTIPSIKFSPPPPPESPELEESPENDNHCSNTLPFKQYVTTNKKGSKKSRGKSKPKLSNQLLSAVSRPKYTGLHVVEPLNIPTPIKAQSTTQIVKKRDVVVQLCITCVMPLMDKVDLFTEQPVTINHNYSLPAVTFEQSPVLSTAKINTVETFYSNQDSNSRQQLDISTKDLSTSGEASQECKSISTRGENTDDNDQDNRASHLTLDHICDKAESKSFDTNIETEENMSKTLYSTEEGSRDCSVSDSGEDDNNLGCHGIKHDMPVSLSIDERKPNILQADHASEIEAGEKTKALQDEQVPVESGNVNKQPATPHKQEVAVSSHHSSEGLLDDKEDVQTKSKKDFTKPETAAYESEKTLSVHDAIDAVRYLVEDNAGNNGNVVDKEKAGSGSNTCKSHHSIESTSTFGSVNEKVNKHSLLQQVPNGTFEENETDAETVHLVMPSEHPECNMSTRGSSSHYSNKFSEVEPARSAPHKPVTPLVTLADKQCQIDSSELIASPIQSFKFNKETHVEQDLLESGNILLAASKKLLRRKSRSRSKDALASQQIIESCSASSKTSKEENSGHWWSRLLLIGLLIAAVCYLISLVLYPVTCDNRCYHCGVFGMKKKYSSIPPH